VQVAMRDAFASLDPAEMVPADIIPASPAQSDSFARRSLTMLMFDTLVNMDENGQVHASLATSCSLPEQPAGESAMAVAHPARSEVQDGTLLSAEAVAASLRTANPAWNVSAEGDSVVIELGALILSCWRSWRWAKCDCEEECGQHSERHGTFHVRIGSRERNWSWRRTRTVGVGVRFSTASRLKWGKVFVSR